MVKKEDEELTVDYIVMEYIPGPTLRSTMPQDGLKESEKGVLDWIKRYFLPVMEGVETIHAISIVHRDLKPENVLLDGSITKITDFGLAGGPRWQQLTRSHHVIGTIQYMPPEQFLEMGETDFRGDIYALGKILYEAVSGKMGKDMSFPFKTARLSNADTPFLKRLDHIVQQATAEERKERFSSVKTLRQAILDLLNETEESEVSPPASWLREPSTEGLKLRKSGIMIGAIGLTAVVIVGLIVLLQMGRLSESIGFLQPFLRESTHKPDIREVETVLLGTSTPASLRGKDEAALLLVPGADFLLPSGAGPQAGKSVKVNSLYMDETEVTNHQYVEFLNQVLRRIRVENGVVYGDGQIWLMLGEVEKGYEPIVFKDGKFFIIDPGLASHPVIRVTGYGAAAYAQFYGRRLPTEAEWLYVLTAGKRK